DADHLRRGALQFRRQPGLRYPRQATDALRRRDDLAAAPGARAARVLPTRAVSHLPGAGHGYGRAAGCDAAGVVGAVERGARDLRQLEAQSDVERSGNLLGPARHGSTDAAEARAGGATDAG